MTLFSLKPGGGCSTPQIREEIVHLYNFSLLPESQDRISHSKQQLGRSYRDNCIFPRNKKR